MPTRVPRHSRVAHVGAAVCLVLALAPSPSLAQPIAPERTAVEHLRRAEDFEGVAVSDSGSQPATVTALRVIVSQPRERALSLLHELMGKASPAGKLYALCGLYKLDKAAFERALPPFLTDDSKVGCCESGCIAWHRPIREIVLSPSPYALRLPLDGSMDKEAWLKTQPWVTFIPPKNDIRGGGWPTLLLPDDPDSSRDSGDDDSRDSEDGEDGDEEDQAPRVEPTKTPIKELLAAIPDELAGDKVPRDLLKKLAAHGLDALPAIKTLLKSTSRPRALVALAAIVWLGHSGLGARGEEAAAALIPYLESKDSALFCAAARAYQRISPWNTAARQAVRRVLERIPEDLDNGISGEHESWLGDLVRWSTSPADLPLIVGLIESPSEEIAHSAAERCGDMGPAAGAARAVLLTTPGSWSRFRILRKIGLEPDCPEIATCVEYLKHPEEYFVIGAIQMLETLGREAPPAVVKAVAKAAEQRSDSRAIVATAALARRTFTGETKGLGRVLIKAHDRAELIQHLKTTRLSDPDDVAALREALTGAYVRARDMVLRALGELGPLARALEPELSALKPKVRLEGEKAMAQAMALAKALHAATGERAWPCLVAAKHLEANVRTGIRALERFGPIPACHIADVEAVIPKLETSELDQALAVLLPLGRASIKITLSLIQRLLSAYPIAAVDALKVLAKARCPEAMAALRDLADRPYEDLPRYLAREAIRDLQAGR